jgi:hypothetical protein
LEAFERNSPEGRISFGKGEGGFGYDRGKGLGLVIPSCEAPSGEASDGEFLGGFVNSSNT